MRDLVERAQQGDREAYELLARGAARRLFLIASRILRDADAAEDAVQHTLVTIWRDLPSLRDPARFDAWTYRIVIRAAGAADRYIVLDVGGRPVVIQISAPSPAALTALLPEAMPIVQSFRFAP